MFDHLFKGVSVFLADDGPRLCLIDKEAYLSQRNDSCVFWVCLLMGCIIDGKTYDKGSVTQVKTEKFLSPYIKNVPETLEFASVLARFLDDSNPPHSFDAKLVKTERLYKLENIYIAAVCGGGKCIIGNDTYVEGEFITRTPEHIQRLPY